MCGQKGWQVGRWRRAHRREREGGLGSLAGHVEGILAGDALDKVEVSPLGLSTADTAHGSKGTCARAASQVSGITVCARARCGGWCVMRAW